MPKLNWPTSVVVYTDGASRGNPGPASIGIVFEDSEGQVLFEHGEKIGHQTNNFAEYTAVIRALQLALENGVNQVQLKSDSELMVKQVKGIYKVKAPQIQPLHMEVKKLISKFVKAEFIHVRREYNLKADRLANEALDSSHFG